MRLSCRDRDVRQEVSVRGLGASATLRPMRAFWFSFLVLAACSGDDTPPGGGPLPDCGVGCGDAARLEVDRQMMDFGSVAVSSTSPLSTIQISNTGTASSGTIVPAVTGSSAAEFIVTNGCTTLAGGGTCVMTVSFKPTTMGQKIADLVVSGSPGGTIKVTLVGSATNEGG